jgi:glycosyltransferase involved in cell wall biosynthesis
MRIVFVSDRKDSHRARFDEFFESLTSDFTSVDMSDINTNSKRKLSANWNSIDEFKTYLSSKPTLLISGPLDSVSHFFIGGDYLHAGISWATDLMVFAASSHDHLIEMSKTVQDLDLVFVDNYPCENILVSMGVKEKDIVRAPWGPEFELTFEGRKSIDKALGPGSIRKVLFGRTLAPHYEPEVFLEAFSLLSKEIDDVYAVLIDSGTYVNHVKELILELDLEKRIIWEKKKSAAGYLKLINEADVFVTTPKTDGTSVSVLQAMHLGVPIVSSETNGSAEWVIAGITGWTFPKGDHLQLHIELKDVLSTSRKSKELITQNARKLVHARAGWNTSKKRISDRIESMMVENPEA